MLFVAVLSVVSLASCKKTSTCNWDGATTTCNDCSAALTKSFKDECNAEGGTYSKK